MDLSNMPVACVGKTPVSVLQELLSRRGTTPRYELVQIEGAIHEPTFRYRVTVADVVAMGTGRSKKEAKHAAAKALLDKMIVGPGEEGSMPVGTNNSMPEVKIEASRKQKGSAADAGSSVDKIDGAVVNIIEKDNLDTEMRSLEWNSNDHYVKTPENKLTKCANKILPMEYSLIATKLNIPSKRKSEEDPLEFLKLKKFSLEVDIMEKTNYLKSLEILKFEKDLDLPPSKFTEDIVSKSKDEISK